MCNLENGDPNDVSRPLVLPTDRRLFLTGQSVIPFVTIIAHIELAEAQTTKGVSINQTAKDGRMISAYFTAADKKDASVFILISNRWGLNDNNKTMAKNIRAKECHAIAIDLFNGSVATNRDEAKSQTKGVKASKANATIAA